MKRKIVLSTSVADGCAHRHRRNATHPSKKGRRMQIVGLTIAVKPQSSPYADQCKSDAESRKLKVAHMINASISAARLWSHVHSSGYKTAYGSATQSHADARPIFSPKTFFPTAWIGQH